MKLRPVNRLLAVCLMAGFGVCHANEQATEETTPRVQAASHWQSVAQDILMNALNLTGVRYTPGGSSPETGFDCSGFVRYVFQQATSLTLPHGARALSQLGQSISVDQLQPGDLVFFNTLKSAFSHVGIYIGDNRFIHAPSKGETVRIVNMNETYWAQRFNGARRITQNSAQPADGVSAE